MDDGKVVEPLPDEPPPVPPKPVRLLRSCCVGLAVETDQGFHLAAVFREALERIANPRTKRDAKEIAKEALQAERSFGWGGMSRPRAVLYWAGDPDRTRGERRLDG